MVENYSTPDPIVGVYRGGRRQDDTCTQALQVLRNVGADILPLVDDLAIYPQSVPSVLHPINGMKLDPADAELNAPAGRILEMLRLLRKQRRLFISYKRTASREVAVQLYYLLQERRFDVFLDTHGVRTGDRFQKELGQRLLDADVMIFLDTTGATASEWIRKEIEIANAPSIGVLQVVFPRPPAADGRLDRALFTALCEPLELSAADFEGQDPRREGGEPLKPEVLTRIALRVEGLRARSTASRRNRLTSTLLAALDNPTYWVRLATRSNPAATSPCVERSGDCRVFPQIGVVDFPCLHRAEMDAASLPVAVLYDPSGLRDESQRHLDWLCRYTKIAPISFLNTEQWVSAG